ncbi:MAG: dehydrogenase [Thalassobius sp.]|nr:dehydrogenase [Thalassovita sp.]
MKNSPLIFLSFLLFTCNSNQTSIKENQQSPEIADMEIMEGFKIEPFAKEPLIADPVAMEIDEKGDIYVVEMHGYPLDLSKSGLIKKLIDTDGDGLPDKSEIFADSLQLPNGILKWKNGFIVTDAPNVYYLEDSDGDGKADIRETLLTGFALSNPQHNLNTPKFGLDNWIYLGHEPAITPYVYTDEFGDIGSNVKYLNTSTSPDLGENANGRMVRFKPESEELEALSGETQFGHTTDAWNHRIYTSNAEHLFHEVLAAEYIANNPNLLIRQAIQRIPDHGDAAKIFPITENPNHQLLTDVGLITSSCGVTWYDGGTFGDNFKNITFIAEPVHNLVHADIIEDKGASFNAKRLLENKDFLASKDPWFRPVNFYVGPDGSIYLLDYYRQIIEHPEWMSDEVNESGALYNGIDKGRIYKISPTNSKAEKWLSNLSLDKASPEELAKLLDNSNGWYRKTAQRLLFQNKEKFPVEAVKSILSNAKNPEAKIPAMWLLYDFDQITETDLKALLSDEVAGVRENAIKVIEKQSTSGKSISPELKETLFALSNDSSDKVKYQLLCTSAFIDGSEHVVNEILKQNLDDEWVAIAAIAVSAGKEASLLNYAIENFTSEKSTGKETFFANLAATIANAKNREGLNLIIHSTENAWWQAAALTGISNLWKYKSPSIALSVDDKLALVSMTSQEANPALGKATIELLQITGFPKGAATIGSIAKAEKSLKNSDADTLIKANAIALLSAYDPDKYKPDLIEIVKSSPSDYLKIEAIKALKNSPDEATVLAVIDVVPKLSEDVKPEAIELFMQDKPYIMLFLEAIDQNKISKNDLQWNRMVSLMNYEDDDIRGYARKLLSVNEDRKAVLQEYLPAIEMAGNVQNGKIIFEKLCKTCHQAEEVDGIDFGPNLATLKSRNPHSIVTEIINPNNSIADQYDLWEIELKNGSKISGIIDQDSPQQLTLKQMSGEKVVLQKENIVSQTKSKYSAMPNGLENGISVEEMADIVAFIKQQGA